MQLIRTTGFSLRKWNILSDQYGPDNPTLAPDNDDCGRQDLLLPHGEGHGADDGREERELRDQEGKAHWVVSAGVSRPPGWREGVVLE